jgi:hypothetical protein
MLSLLLHCSCLYSRRATKNFIEFLLHSSAYKRSKLSSNKTGATIGTVTIETATLQPVLNQFNYTSLYVKLINLLQNEVACFKNGLSVKVNFNFNFIVAMCKHTVTLP